MILTIALTFTISSSAKSPVGPALAIANYYECLGAGGLKAVYDATTKVFAVTYEGKNYKWTSKFFTVVPTRLGNLVTGNAPGPATPVDGASFDYSLVAPKVQFLKLPGEARFSSVFVRTTVPSPFMSPESILDNDFRDVDCKAIYK